MKYHTITPDFFISAANFKIVLRSATNSTVKISLLLEELLLELDALLDIDSC